MNPLDLLATPGPDDLVFKLVDFLLPADTQNAYTITLSILASVLLTYATIKLGYFIITATVSAGYTGQVLGDKYHKLWGPIAVILGIGFLTPVWGNGLSAGHHLLRNFVAKPTVNAANAIAVGAAEYIIEGGHPITPISAFGRNLAWSVASSEVCSYVYAGAVKRSAHWGYAPKAPGVPDSTGTLSPVNGSQKVTWDYGKACGAISLSYPSQDEFGEFGAARNAAAIQVIKDVRELGIGLPIAKALEKSGVDAGADGSSEALVTPAQVDVFIRMGALVPGIVESLNAIGDKYNETVAEAAAAEATKGQEEQRKKLVDGVRRYGFVILASYYRTLSQLNEKSAAFANEMPGRIEPNPEAWGSYANEVKYALKLIDSQRIVESSKLALNADDLAFAGEQESSIFADIVNTVTHPLVDYLVSYDGWRNDPVADLMNVGSRMMTGAKIGFSVGMVATGASNFWSSTAGKVVEYAMTPGWWLLGAAYAGGAMISIVLPNLPAIYLIFGVTAFALELIVASIAVLVWAFAHARLDHGDSFIGPVQAPGYKILFGLSLRLPINTLAFIAAHLANTVILNIFLAVWSFGFRGSLGGQTVGLAAIFVGFGLMMYVQWKIVVMMFSLNGNLSERVAQWFGQQTQSWNEHAEGNAVVGAVGGGISGSGSPQRPSPKQPKDKNNNNGGGDGNGSNGMGHRNLSPMAAKAAEPKVLD